MVLQTNFKDTSFYNIQKDGNFLNIYYGTDFMMRVNLKNIDEVKRSIILFKNIDAPTSWLARVFEISRPTIEAWFKIYLNKGMDALLNFRKGPKKITDEIQAYILAKFKELNFVRHYKDIIREKVKEHFGLNLHWRSIIVVLAKSGIDLSIKKNNKKLPEAKTEEVKGNEVVCENAGLFFLYPFLEKLEISSLFSNVRSIFQDTYYSVLEYIYGLFLLYASNMIMVEENIKMHEDKKMHIVLGNKGLPSLSSYRNYMFKIIKGLDIKNFEDKLAEQYYKDHRDCNEIYVDGHFLPYNGKYNTFKGYNPIRRFAQKGRTGYFLNNTNGRPYYYILSDGYKDFREYLAEIAENIKKITGRRSKKDLIMVFDRGGWGKQFLEEIISKITFICWRTGKVKMPKNIQWKKVKIKKKGNKYDDYKVEILEASEERIPVKSRKYAKRNIYIKRGEKISLAFSNDKERELAELVKILTKRWGVQENIFKALKQVGIDKISSYQNENYPEDWLLEENNVREVENPGRKIIEDQLAGLKSDIKNIQTKIGNLYTKSKKKKNRRILDLEKVIEKKSKKISQLKKEHSMIPEKVNITEIIKSKKITRLNIEKKKFLDLIKVLSYNVQQDIVDIVRPIYNNERDVNMFVRQIFNKNGIVILNKNEIKIIFERYTSKRKNEALNYLIDIVNKKNIKHPLLDAKMVFECK